MRKHLGELMADILVVDDDGDTRAMLRELLEDDEHFTVFESPDGESALARLRTHPVPLIVLLDWLMPGLDGIQVLQALAEDAPLTRRHAYILLTAAGISEARPLPPLPPVLDVGVILKPFDIDALLAAIRDAAVRISGPAA